MPVINLWQRIFLYSLLLVVLALVMNTVLHRTIFSLYREGGALEISAGIRETLDGQSLDAVKTALEVFNKQRDRLWLEDSEGNLAAGERFDGKSGVAWQAAASPLEPRKGITLWKTNLPEPHFVAQGRVRVDGRDLTFYQAFAMPPRPPLAALALQWGLAACLAGGALSFWMFRRVSRPLSRLAQELTELREARTLDRVTVSGDNQVAAVAEAVNQLTDSLGRHVRNMRELIVNISHELRPPLTRMSASADMIRQGLFLHPLPRGKGRMSDSKLQEEATVLLAKKHFVALEEELAHMDSVIGSTLLDSRLELRSPEAFSGPVDFSRLCLEAADRFEALFQQEALAFSREVAPGVLVSGDQTLLLQALSNILDNAAKYARRPDGVVRLQLEQKKDHAFLTVENSFDPLPPEDLERMFAPFQRLERHTGSGVGLGLSLVQKIAALHGGEVMALSTDMGVCLCLQLPLREKGGTAYTDAPLQ